MQNPGDKDKPEDEEFDDRVRAAPAYGGPPAWLRAQWKEKQTEFSVTLLSPGANRVLVIKALREARGLTLDDAKKLADTAPVLIAESLPKDEAEALQKKLRDLGATVSIF